MKYLSDFILLLATIALTLSAPAAAVAAVFGSNEVVEVSEPIADDAFLAGEQVSVRQPIADDAFIVGSVLEVSNTIGEDLFAAGNTITVSADIADDAFLAGDLITLERTKVGDLFAAGRFVELSRDATVTGDAYLAGATIVINGTMSGDVRAASERVEVDSGTTIRGDLVVYSRNPPQIAEGAIIAGAVRHVTEVARDQAGVQAYIVNWVRQVLTLFIVSLVALYLTPKLSRTVVDHVPTATISSFGIGLAWLLLLIPVVIALFLTVVGWPLALTVASLSMLIIFLGLCLLPLVAGAWFHQRWIRKTGDSPLQWQHALLGAVIVVSLQWIPIIGPFVIAVLMLTIIGTLLRTFKQYAQ